MDFFYFLSCTDRIWNTIKTKKPNTSGVRLFFVTTSGQISNFLIEDLELVLMLEVTKE